ncbi:potassium channel family protein [Alkalimarinus alittae]|uniref:Potassium channel family protein n=1 Tax=Alkalimarinus alittae TaxID=2961619 RepID=A0ABY6N0A7_9ALTE|nr:potassium channel family protein [Alkalimarinus alittae]UZE95532.1 potassium channel family protein [Alkalimarinus alittae]
MSNQPFPRVIGLAGVDRNENSKALKYAGHLEWPMVLMAIWIIIEWYLQAKGAIPANIILVTDWLIWSFFLFETVLLTSLVRNKKHYLIGNWVNLVIILLGFPLLWEEFPAAGVLRTLRLIVMGGILIHISSTAKRILARNHLGTTLMIGFIITVMAGFLIAGLDPAIETPWEGIWWAWVTVTTVGYGDIVPVSTEGRLFGSFLILMGIGIFSMLTASFSAFFVSRDEKLVVQREQQILAKLELIEMRIHKIENDLNKVAKAQQQAIKNPPTAPY